MFDLTQTRRLSEADRSVLHLIDVDELCSSSASPNPYEDLYNRIESLVQERGARYVMFAGTACLARSAG